MFRKLRLIPSFMPDIAVLGSSSGKCFSLAMKHETYSPACNIHPV